MAPMSKLLRRAASLSQASTGDVGAAEAFEKLYVGRLLHDHTSGAWLEFDGVRWRKDELRQIFQHGIAVSKDLLSEASEMLSRAGREQDPGMQKQHIEESDRLSSAAQALHKKPRLEAMIALAATYPSIAANRAMFDREDLHLCVQNGVLDLTSVPAVHRTSEPSDFLTLQAGCEFERSATSPCWQAFLDRVQPDPEIQAWLRRFIGYCLTGQTSEQLFVVFHGVGSNGKTVFTEVIRKVLGNYCLSADFKTFTADDQDAIRNDLARLDKTRLVLASEGPEGARLDEDLVKRLTGGEEIVARFLHREYFSFKPRFKLVLVTNHKPKIVGTDDGIWRRVVLVPWSISIPREQRDRHLGQRLEQELPGILNWTLKGLEEYLSFGLDPLPEAIAHACREYRRESDTIGMWMEQCCSLDPFGRATSAEIHSSYKAWAAANGYQDVTPKKLANRLKEIGLTSWRSERSRGWQGIACRGW